MKPLLSVVIVSYNTADLIGPCLASLAAERSVPMETFVVDNASSDGSAGEVRKKFPAVLLVENENNRGFGAAVNQVLSRCGGPYLLLLNPDTVVRSGALAEMIRYMDTHARVGLASARLLNPDQTSQDSISFRYPGEKHTSGELRGLPGSIAFAIGACVIIRAELMRQLGGFDEDYFLYGEDQDLCLRIRKAGYEIGYVRPAEVLHYGGRSERAFAPGAVWKKKYDAEYLFYRKHYRAGTIRRIIRAHIWRTKWRLAALNLSLLVARDRGAIAGKAQKYLALREVALVQKQAYL